MVRFILYEKASAAEERKFIVLKRVTENLIERYISITDQGYAVLKEWLDRTDYPHNEFLLRLYFGSIRPIKQEYRNDSMTSRQ